MTKTDKELGLKIHKHLYELGIETPLKDFAKYSENDKSEIIEKSFKNIMQVLGLDLQDDSLAGTPQRISKMFLYEIFSGLNYNNFPKATTVENKMRYDEMVIINDITVSSTCEHHFVTIDGMAKIAYIPNKVVLGLSKFNRIVDFFSRRPQIQERLTEQIYFALALILDTENIAVEVVAVHHCVKSRGVKDTHSYTTTRKLGGDFKTDLAVRNEFLNTK